MKNRIFKCHICGNIIVTKNKKIKCESCKNEYTLENGKYYRRNVYFRWKEMMERKS